MHHFIYLQPFLDSSRIPESYNQKDTVVAAARAAMLLICCCGCCSVVDALRARRCIAGCCRLISAGLCKSVVQRAGHSTGQHGECIECSLNRGLKHRHRGTCAFQVGLGLRLRNIEGFLIELKQEVATEKQLIQTEYLTNKYYNLFVNRWKMDEQTVQQYLYFVSLDKDFERQVKNPESRAFQFYLTEQYLLFQEIKSQENED